MAGDVTKGRSHKVYGEQKWWLPQNFIRTLIVVGPVSHRSGFLIDFILGETERRQGSSSKL
jgi:hypothetical protein